MISINLLPKERQALYQGRRRNRRILAWGSTIISLILLITLALGGAGFYLSTTLTNEKELLEQAQDNLNRYKEIETLVITARDRVKSLTDQEKRRVRWSEIAEELAAT